MDECESEECDGQCLECLLEEAKRKACDFEVAVELLIARKPSSEMVDKCSD